MSFVPPLGWVEFSDRTPEGNAAHAEAVGEMPQFAIEGAFAEAAKKILLTEVWKHPQVQSAIGFDYERVHQITGSCVGAGGGNAAFTLLAIEVIRLSDPEQIVVPFWLLPYGKSRQMAGMRGRGSGSFGSTFAKAVKEFGFIDARTEGLPEFKNADGLIWGKETELQWSDGAAIPEKWLTMARKHPVRTTAVCPTPDDVRQAIQNLYPCTAACGLYVGHGKVKGSGDDAVLVGSLDTKGGHQTTILGWQEHPQLGDLFLYQNQWPESVYPEDPAGGPVCSVWIDKANMKRICDEGEVYAFSQFDGYPTGDPKILDWIIAP